MLVFDFTKAKDVHLIFDDTPFIETVGDKKYFNLQTRQEYLNHREAHHKLHNIRKPIIEHPPLNLSSFLEPLIQKPVIEFRREIEKPKEVETPLSDNEKKRRKGKSKPGFIQHKVMLKTEPKERKKFGRPVDTAKQTFVCDYCDTGFTLRQNVQAHLDIYHPFAAVPKKVLAGRHEIKPEEYKKKPTKRPRKK